MADAFSAEWAAGAAELWPYLPPAPGAEGTVRLAVAVAPRREVAFQWRYRGGEAVAGADTADGADKAGGAAGRVAAGGAGGAGGAVGAVGQPEVTLTLAAADAADVLSGQVEPSVAFMRGRLKASGDGALLLAFLSSTTDAGFDEWRRRVAGLPGRS